MRYVCLLASMIPLLSGQDGGAIYKERCASCHDAPEGRVPSIKAIKAMSGEAIYLALTSGTMKSRAEGLTTAQIFALIGYIAPTGGTQKTPAAIERTCKRGIEVSSGPPPTRRDGMAGARASPIRASRMQNRRSSRPRTCLVSS